MFGALALLFSLTNAATDVSVLLELSGHSGGDSVLFFSSAIATVRSEMESSKLSWEVLVIAGGPFDYTKDRLLRRSLDAVGGNNSLRVVWEDTVCASFNAAFLKAQGAYILLMGDRVHMEPGTVAHMIGYLNSNLPCVDDPKFNQGYGPCYTYRPGSRNHQYCKSDGADMSCPASCAACPVPGMVGGKLVYPHGTVHHAGYEYALESLPGYSRWSSDDADRRNVPTPYLRYKGLREQDSRVTRSKPLLGIGRELAMIPAYVADLLNRSLFNCSYDKSPQRMDCDLSLRVRAVGLTVQYEAGIGGLVFAADADDHPDSNLAQAKLFDQAWGSSLWRYLERKWAVQNVNLVWNMECGTGQVLGFTTEAVLVITAIEGKIPVVKAEVSDLDNCLSELAKGGFPSSTRRAVQRMGRIHLHTTLRNNTDTPDPAFLSEDKGPASPANHASSSLSSLFGNSANRHLLSVAGEFSEEFLKSLQSPVPMTGEGISGFRPVTNSIFHHSSEVETPELSHGNQRQPLAVPLNSPELAHPDMALSNPANGVAADANAPAKKKKKKKLKELAQDAAAVSGTNSTSVKKKKGKRKRTTADPIPTTPSPTVAVATVGTQGTKPPVTTIPPPDHPLTILVLHRDCGRYPSFLDSTDTSVVEARDWSARGDDRQLNDKYVYVVGRSMFETDRIEEQWAKNVNISAIREVWLPSHFNVDTFAKSGADRRKLRVLPEPVDHYHYDPNTAPLLPLHFPGEPSTPYNTRDSLSPSSVITNTAQLDPTAGSAPGNRPFRFLAIMKWENRKGWREALGAYFTEFSSADNVLFLLRSKLDSSAQSDLDDFIRDYLAQWNAGNISAYVPSVAASGPLPAFTPAFGKGRTLLSANSGRKLAVVEDDEEDDDDDDEEEEEAPAPSSAKTTPPPTPSPTRKLRTKADLPKIQFLSDLIPLSSLPSLYRAVDALVSTNHGEGWGLPLVEAMAMHVPLIATNWSGSLEFMNGANSFPVPVQKLVPATTHGHLWAEPDVVATGRIMKCVYLDVTGSQSAYDVCKGVPGIPTYYPGIAQTRASQARTDVVSKFSQRKIAQLVIEEVERIKWVALEERATRIRTKKQQKDSSSSLSTSSYRSWDSPSTSHPPTSPFASKVQLSGSRVNIKINN